MNTQDKQIKQSLESKNWNEIKTKDSWQILKLCLNLLKDLKLWQKLVPVFQFLVPRTNKDSTHYHLAEEIAFKLTQKGYGVITGGGPGIMGCKQRKLKKGKGNQLGLILNFHLNNHQIHI